MAVYEYAPENGGALDPENKPYPAATIRMDRIGSLHIWRGERHDNPGREADVFVEHGSDAQTVLAQLPAVERESVERGWDVITHFLPDEYFSLK